MKNYNNLLVLSIISLFFVVTSCSKESTELSDLETIEAIEKAADKQDVEFNDLPDPTNSTLTDVYTEDYFENAQYAYNLGYKVRVRKEEGPWAGECLHLYFNNNGRELTSGGENGNNNKWNWRHRYTRGCFELVLPVTYTMPDESEIVIESKNDWTLIKNWYRENQGVTEKPELQYPVEINYHDGGNIVIIQNEEEMIAAKEDC